MNFKEKFVLILREKKEKKLTRIYEGKKKIVKCENERVHRHQVHNS